MVSLYTFFFIIYIIKKSKSKKKKKYKMIEQNYIPIREVKIKLIIAHIYVYGYLFIYYVIYSLYKRKTITVTKIKSLTYFAEI